MATPAADPSTDPVDLGGRARLDVEEPAPNDERADDASRSSNAPGITRAAFSAGGEGLVSTRGGIVSDPADIPPLPDVRVLRQEYASLGDHDDRQGEPGECEVTYVHGVGWQFSESCDCSTLPGPFRDRHADRFECDL